MTMTPIVDSPRAQPAPAPPAAAGAALWHALTADDALRLAASSAGGLTQREADARLASCGPNRLVAEPPEPAWRILARQLASVIVVLLVGAAALAIATGDRADAAAIGAVLVLDVALGFATELRARRAMEALLALQVARAQVMRDGARREIDAAALVPGDVILLEEGMSVPADARLLAATELRATEALLTGESVPVAKRADPPAPAAAPLAARPTMVYAGTTVATGVARALVVATGMASELGRVDALARGVAPRRTPLERRLDALGARLTIVALAAALVIGGVQLAQGISLSAVAAAAIAVAVAAVPEALPAVVTIAMAVAVWRMAARRAMVRRLATVESVGETTVVCVDKTGTLTLGAMTATTLWVGGVEHDLAAERPPSAEVDASLADAVRIATLANRAELRDEAGGRPERGDPTEVALLVAAAKLGVTRRSLARDWPRVAELPFSSERMLMGTVHRSSRDRTLHAFVKGAPQRILPRCDLGDEARARLLAVNGALAARGLRVLALADRALPDDADVDSPAALDRAFHRLRFVGFVGVTDPPAPGVTDTLARLRHAGIHTLMLTGDQEATAAAVARDLGILGASGAVLDGAELAIISDDALHDRIARVHAVSRASPEAKLRVVRALQRRGEIVAMLGDGVNDAPALRQADVGVAMGGRGTDVAKEAAGIVLADDRFATIAAAVEEGRAVFDNVRRFVFYLLACNLAELATLAAGGLVGAAVPLLPLQILWLNLVTDTLPALALALEPAAPRVMHRPPRRPGAPLLSGRLLGAALALAVLVTAATLAAYALGARAGAGSARGRTLAFMTLAFAQLWLLAVARRSSRGGRGARGVREPRRGRNPYALFATALAVTVQLAAALTPPVARALHLVPLAAGDWLTVAALSLAPLFLATLALEAERAAHSDPA